MEEGRSRRKRAAPKRLDPDEEASKPQLSHDPNKARRRNPQPAAASPRWTERPLGTGASFGSQEHGAAGTNLPGVGTLPEDLGWSGFQRYFCGHSNQVVAQRWREYNQSGQRGDGTAALPQKGNKARRPKTSRRRQPRLEVDVEAKDSSEEEVEEECVAEGDEPAAAAAAGASPVATSGGTLRRRRPASAALVQAIAMAQHTQRVVAERRAAAAAASASLLGKRVIVRWNEDESYAGEAAEVADADHENAGAGGVPTMRVLYDDGEEIWETIEPGKFREIPEIHCSADPDDPEPLACQTCGNGELLGTLHFCNGCDGAHHERCGIRGVSVQRNRDVRTEWYCEECTEKQGDCKACRGGHCGHTCDEGRWRIRHSRRSSVAGSKKPGARWTPSGLAGGRRRPPSAYRLPMGSPSPRPSPRARSLSWHSTAGGAAAGDAAAAAAAAAGGEGGAPMIISAETWSATEDADLRSIVERKGLGSWPSKAAIFNQMSSREAEGERGSERSESALRHRWTKFCKAGSE